MNFICPKCTNPIEQNLESIPSEGLATKCPSCNARVQLVKVSFARMAYFKAGMKNCANCGNQLGHSLHCPSCRLIYPDFFIAADPAVIRRQAREQRQQRMFSSFQGLEFSFPDFKSRTSDSKKTGYNPQRAKKSDTQNGEKPRPTMPRKLIAALIIVAIIVGGGYTAYARHKAEQVYMASYFKALYGIQSGVEITIQLNSKMATDWKATQEAGKVYISRTMPDEEAQLVRVKSEVDKFVKQLTPPSAKFQKSQQSLIALNNQYNQIHNLAITPPSTLPALNAALTTSKAQLAKKSEELKSSLDEDMKAELLKAKQTYKVLKDF